MLEELVFKAGEAKEAPPLPPGGIPEQWLPAWIRWPLRSLFLPFVWIDIAMQRFARLLIPPPYKKVGQCLRRGNCCHYIMIQKPKGLLGKLYLFWCTQVNGFYLRSQEVFEYENRPVLVMGCRYLKKDGSCRRYFWRPMICRKWPVIEHFGHPKILKGCGFKAVPKRSSLDIID